MGTSEWPKVNEPSFIKPCHLSDFPWFLTVKKNAKYFEIKPDVQTFITEFTNYTGTINQQGHSNMISSFIPRLTQQKFRFHYKPWIHGVLNSRMPTWNHRSPVFWISDYILGNHSSDWEFEWEDPKNVVLVISFCLQNICIALTRLCTSPEYTLNQLTFSMPQSTKQRG